MGNKRETNDTMLFEQYKAYVDSACKVTEWRNTANNFLLAINAFLVTLYGAFSVYTKNGAWDVSVPIAGILVCVTWLALIRSYKTLNSAKFKVIHEIEQNLPEAPYTKEWEKMGKGEGDYLPLTHIEQIIPGIFIALYLFLGVASCARINVTACQHDSAVIEKK